MNWHRLKTVPISLICKINTYCEEDAVADTNLPIRAIHKMPRNGADHALIGPTVTGNVSLTSTV
jgi:hypothetical protein